MTFVSTFIEQVIKPTNQSSNQQASQSAYHPTNQLTKTSQRSSQPGRKQAFNQSSRKPTYPTAIVINNSSNQPLYLRTNQTRSSRRLAVSNDRKIKTSTRIFINQSFSLFHTRHNASFIFGKHRLLF